MDLNKIASALRVIADALEASAERPPVDQTHLGDPGPDPIEEVIPAPVEITLAMLQELGADLIKTGKRDYFVGVLAEMGVKNLSGLEPAGYPKVYELLKGL